MYIVFLILYGILGFFGFIGGVVRNMDYGKRLIDLVPILLYLGHNELAKKCRHHADKYQNYHPMPVDTDGRKEATEIGKEICKIKVNKNDKNHILIRKYQIIVKFHKISIVAFLLGCGFLILSAIFGFISQTG